MKKVIKHFLKGHVPGNAKVSHETYCGIQFKTTINGKTIKLKNRKIRFTWTLGYVTCGRCLKTKKYAELVRRKIIRRLGGKVIKENTK